MIFGPLDVLFVVAGVAVGAVTARSTHRRFRASMVADSLGLSRDGSAIVGLYEDVPVYLDTRTTARGPITVARFRLTEALPSGLRMGGTNVWRRAGPPGTPLPTVETLARQLGARGAAPEAIADLLAPDVVQRALLEFLITGGSLQVTGLDLTLERRGSHLDEARRIVDEGTHIVHTLTHARRDAWIALAEEVGLTADSRAQHLEGTVDGVPVDVWFESGSIVTQLRSPLPRGTLVLHRDHAVRDDRRPTALGDPILDRLLVAYTSDPDALRARVSRDEVRGPLLEVVHGHPGSMVTEDRVRLALGWAAGRLRPAFSAAHGLAQSLGGWPDATQTPRLGSTP